MMRIPAYAKTIVALIGAVLAVVAPIIGQDEFLTTTDIVQMGIGILTALGVYKLPNAPDKEPTAPAQLVTQRVMDVHGRHESP